jgi:hypothetical protein
MKTDNLLKGARVYLSGPMDFVASREKEKKYGWRTRIAKFLRINGATVFDPWNKPHVMGLHEYGREDINTVKLRENWSFKDDEKGRKSRAECAKVFWETMHIDLRMVDISDFVIAYCPTNIYSVGTVHEIVVAREQHKPVLFVSPSVSFPTLSKLISGLKDQPELLKLVEALKNELPIKENTEGIPSLWYMPLISSECFFDGFGFMNLKYKYTFKWEKNTEIDIRESEDPPERPLLNFLDKLTMGKIPHRWSSTTNKLKPDDDWLLLKESLTK